MAEEETGPVRNHRDADGNILEFTPGPFLSGREDIEASGPEKAVMLHLMPNSADAAKNAVISQDHPWSTWLSGFVHAQLLSNRIRGDDHEFLLSQLKTRDIYLLTANGLALGMGPEICTKIYGSATELSLFEINGGLFYSDWPDVFPPNWQLTDPVPIDPLTRKPFSAQTFSNLFKIGGMLAYAEKHPTDKRRLIHLPTPLAIRSFYYIPEQNVFAEKRRPWKVYSAGSLDNTFSPNKTERASLAEALSNSNHVRRVSSLGYQPGIHGVVKSVIVGDDEEHLELNQFKPPKIRPRRGDLGPLYGLFNRWGLSEEEIRPLLAWMRAVVLGYKPKWGVLLTSTQHGIGKNTLADFLAHLIGKWNCTWPTVKSIKDERNQWAINKRLVIVSEVYEGKSWAMANQLKVLVGDDTPIPVNPKNIAAYFQTNHLCFLLFSNTRDALKLDDEDRRWLVYHVNRYEKLPPQEEADYWRSLRKWWFVDGGAEAFMYWLINERPEWIDDYDIDGNAPRTVDREILVESSRMDGRYDLQDALRDKKALVWQDLKKWAAENGHTMHNDEIEKELGVLGFVPANGGNRIKIGNQSDGKDHRISVTVWAKSNGKVTSEMLKAMFESQEFGALSHSWHSRITEAFRPYPI